MLEVPALAEVAERVSVLAVWGRGGVVPGVEAVEECAGCGHQESVTTGTMFHGTRKPLKLWFRAITMWVMSKRGLSAKELARQLGLHYETAWMWCHRLRDCVGRAFGQEPLFGVVEVDETYLGGTDDKAHKGRSLAGRKALVAGAVEVRDGKMGRVRLERLKAADNEALGNFALLNIEQRSVAKTDGLASYDQLPRLGIGHQKNVIGKDPKQAVKLLPHIHTVFSLFKQGPPKPLFGGDCCAFAGEIAQVVSAQVLRFACRNGLSESAGRLLAAEPRACIAQRPIQVPEPEDPLRVPHVAVLAIAERIDAVPCVGIEPTNRN